MVSKNTIKLIKSLALKKVRNKEKLFLVEGDKNVAEVLHSAITIEKLIATQNFLDTQKVDINKIGKVIEASPQEIKKASILKNPQNSIAVCKLPDSKKLPENFESDLSIFLDDIQDPGNLGTIIRICDWFGINQLFCSLQTADVYNPKVIQASMGSFCRVDIFYTTIEILTGMAAKNQISLAGAFLEGENIYEQKMPKKLLLIMGNEGNGISSRVEKKIEKKFKIPAFNTNSSSAESLNVSVATAIFCSEFKRQKHFPFYSK